MALKKKFHLSTILERSLKEKGFDVNVINASVSGDTTSGGLNRLEWLLQNRNVDIVVLCLGANDMLRGIKPSLIEQNLNKKLEILREKKIVVLLAGMLSQKNLGEKYIKNNLIIYTLNLQKNFKSLFYHFYWMELRLILS